MAARGDDWPTRQLARFQSLCAQLQRSTEVARTSNILLMLVEFHSTSVHLVASCRDKRRQVATGAFLAFEIASFRSECRLCVRFTVNSSSERRPPEIADEYLYLCPCRLIFRGAPRPIA